ncbi:MAG: hypothetical protein Q9170_008055 [Blastenia crenularia]
MASPTTFDTHLTDQKVKTLVNAQLKAILKKEKLAVSGLKATMQNRIIGRKLEQFFKLHNYARNRDVERLNRLRGFISNPEALQSSAPSLPSAHVPYHEFSGAAQSLNLPPIMPPGTSGAVKPIFKDSPFYTILEPLTPVQECKALVREATRDQVECKINLGPDVTDKLTTNPSVRVMIFCASEPISHFAKVDITFPHQVEIKVNMDEVKANLRGLKNRPGSTRPADITTLLRKRANYDNTLSLIYALTHKKFYFVVNLVQRNSVEELVAKLKSGKTISKEQVIREMVNKAQDNDVQATGANMSLKCPLYVDGILKTTPRSVDQVTVQPDGKWSRIAAGDPSPRRNDESSEEDEDLIEVKDPPRLTAVKSEINSGSSLMRTPPASSREQSSSSVPPTSAGAKRSASAVIDLTSDDEEEEGQRSSKRPALPAYLGKSNYNLTDHTNSHPRAGNSTPSGPYTTNPSTKPNYFRGGYPRPP